MESKAEILNLSDDGIISNSKFPVMIYHRLSNETGKTTVDFWKIGLQKAAGAMPLTGGFVINIIPTPIPMRCRGVSAS